MIGLFKSAPDFRALLSTFSQNKRSFCHIDVLLVFVIPLFSLHPKIPAQVPAPNISFQPLSSSELLMLRFFFFYFFFPQPFPFGFVFSAPSRVKIHSGDTEKVSDCDQHFIENTLKWETLVQLLKTTGIFLPFLKSSTPIPPKDYLEAAGML